jgi:hypothetical protein
MTTYGEIFREIEQHMYADHQKRHAGPDPRIRALAEAMLDAKAGASGARNGHEQMRLTMAMAEWVIQRLAFHGLALIEYSDGLSDEERIAAYRKWLHRDSRRVAVGVATPDPSAEG